jgi:hypothetical protein
MNNKILIINSFWSDVISEDGVNTLKTRKELKSVIGRMFRAVHILFNLPLKHIWDVKKWWEKCRGYDLIILMDSSKDIIYQSKKIEEVVSTDTRLVFYMLNPVFHTGDQHLLLSNRWEIWSFSKKESDENGFKYGETFYFKKIAALNKNTVVKFDSFFIGLDKGRLKMLDKLKDLYKSYGLNYQFYIVDNRKSLYSRKYKKNIPYMEVVKFVQESKSITEVVQKEQEGMTLRVMESVFLKRKLITTNQYIKTRRIYNPENIFILGEDDNDKLSHFINTPYIEVDVDEVEKYEFTSWLNRIILNKKFE